MEEKRAPGPQLGIRLNPKERDTIRRAADKAERKESDWARNRLLNRAREELAGTAPEVRTPDPEEEAALKTLREAMAADTELPDAAIALVRLATTRPLLARALKDLALVLRDAPPGSEGTVRRGPRRSRRVSGTG